MATPRKDTRTGSRGTRPRSLRIPTELWETTLANAEKNGETLTEVVLAAMVSYNRKADRKAKAEAGAA